IWDRENLKKLTTIEAPNSSECFWSPDGPSVEQYPMRTLSPPPKVSEDFGALAAKPSRNPSVYLLPAVKNKKKREAAKKKKEEANLASEKNVVSSLHQSPAPTQQVIDNDIIDTDNVTDLAKEPIASALSTNGTSQGGSSLSETDKKIRNLTKKLRQIAELKERQQKGDKLELTQ
ncbi:7770_t:CDS:2, partial [Racocetra fulgida]